LNIFLFEIQLVLEIRIQDNPSNFSGRF